MKKFISIILAIALLAVPFCGVTALADDSIGTELVTNGGFDDAATVTLGTLGGWTYSNASRVAATSDYANAVGKTGDYCAQLNNVASAFAVQRFKVKGGNTYNLTFLIAPGAYGGKSSTTRVLAKNIDTGTTYLQQDIVSYNYGYQTVNYSFECDADGTLQLMFMRTSADGFTVHIDDISLVSEVADVDYSQYINNELVTNGDFEEGHTSNWSGHGNGLTIQNGSAFYWHGGNGTLSTDVKVEQGRTYKVSYQWRSGASYDFTVKAVQSANTLYSSTWKTENTNEAYWNRSYSFTAIADGTATISFNCNPSDQLTFIDNVSVTPVISEVPVDAIANGGFDTADNWNIIKAEITTAPNGIGKDGDSAIGIANFDSGVMQIERSLKAGVKYKLSFKWAPCYVAGNGEIANADSIIKVMVWNGDWNAQNDASNVLYSDTFKSKNYAYYECSAIFTSKVDTNTARIRFYEPVSPNGKVYIDDVSLVPVNNENAVVNGNFEVSPAPAGALDYFKEANNYYGWCLEGTAATVSDAEKGSIVLKVTGTTDGAYGHARVSNSDNIIAFNYKGDVASSTKIVVSSDYEGTNILAEKTVTGTGAWEQILVDSNIATGDVYIHVVSLAGTNYFDNVSIMSYDVATVTGFAPTMDDEYIYDISGADVKAGYSCDNAVISVSDDSAATGVKVKATIGGKFILWEKEIVINGDATGDGVCNIIDLVAAKKQSVGMNRLSGAYLRAVCSGEDVGATDLTALRKKLMTGF